MPTDQTADHILIVGGGIGGLALGVALRRHGLAATVCERAPALREIGAGLLLTPNASWVLHRLGLLEQAQERGRTVGAWRILDTRGRTLQRFAVGGKHAPSISLTRSALQGSLRDALAPGALRLGLEAAGVDPRGPAVRFTNGETLRARLVVGADGGRSVVRRDVFGPEAPRFSGYVGWRALVPGIPDGWDRDGGLVTETWGRGRRFGLAPVNGTHAYWYASENVPGLPGGSPGERKEHLRDRFRGWHDPIGELIERTPPGDILLSEIAEHRRVRFSCPRAGDACALLGDAAHLMTPNLGQGAALALEDAWVLADCLARHGVGGPDGVAAALAAYRRRRTWRAVGASVLSRRLGEVIQWEHPWLATGRDAALRCTPDPLGSVALAPVFRFRV